MADPARPGAAPAEPGEAGISPLADVERLRLGFSGGTRALGTEACPPGRLRFG
ncbi:hypothetical protein ACFCZ1_18360 [Streptomyces sp. NPDC056224]|uniref:hypothetical protein n=1 Tax=Streptomyces sp. NPDC056224 TaxID=3345750 RepID=UPI0035DBBEC4